MFRPPVIVLVCLILVPVTALGFEHYCTLEAQTWGARGASFNGIRIPSLVDTCVTAAEPVVVGVPGRSVTFTEGSEPSIVSGLPGRGNPAPLPPGIGDLVIDSPDALPPGLPLNGRQRFWTSLLGQTVALSLNTRLDPGLALAPVAHELLTVAALPGDDGLLGTDDDVMCEGCDTLKVRIPYAVLWAVEDATGEPPTVGGLLEVASDLLGGEGPGLGLREVGHALRGVNRAFAESRFLVSVPPDTGGVPVLRQAPTATGEAASLSLAAAGPVGGAATLRLTLDRERRVRVVAYTASGREAGVVAERDFPAGVSEIPFPSDRGLPSGIYFVRAMTADAGAPETRTTTVVLLR